MQNVLECRFGSIEYNERFVIHFPEGLYGFEDQHRFLLWEDERYLPFHWLISLDDPKTVFPMIDPSLVHPGYRSDIGFGNGDHVVMVIVTIGDTEQVTVNLRAPILLYPGKKQGRQLILADSDYPVRHRIHSSGEE